MKPYFPYCMIGLMLAVTWRYYSTDAHPAFTAIAALAVVFWGVAAWQERELRRLKRTIETLKKWREEP